MSYHHLYSWFKRIHENAMSPQEQQLAQSSNCKVDQQLFRFPLIPMSVRKHRFCSRVYAILRHLHQGLIYARCICNNLCIKLSTRCSRIQVTQGRQFALRKPLDGHQFHHTGLQTYLNTGHHSPTKRKFSQQTMDTR